MCCLAINFLPSGLVPIFGVGNLKILVERLEELGNGFGSHFSLSCQCLKNHR